MKNTVILIFIFSTIANLDSRSIVQPYKKMLYCKECIAETPESLSIKIVNLMKDAKYEEVRTFFSSDLKASLTASQLKEPWVSLQIQFGKIASFGKPNITEVEGYKKIVILINYEKGKANFELYFNSTNEVTGIWLKPVQ